MLNISNANDNATTIKFGKPNDLFTIHSATKHSTIIHAPPPGIIFAGDFPHFGVTHVESTDNALNEKIKQLFNNIDKQKNRKTGLRRVFNTTKDLDELCRFFLKTKPKNNKFQYYHLDGVGICENDIIENCCYDYPIDAETAQI